MATTEGSVRYDSRFEERLHKGVLKRCEVHPKRLPYKVHAEYEPDFQYGKTLIEAKGRFRERKEASKYLWVRQYLPRGYELVFVFMNPNTPMPHAKKRKCGTKQTVSEWATKNDFKWFTMATIGKYLGSKK